MVPESPIKEIEKQTESDIGDKYKLTLYNDDINTFDYVIISLVEVCHHDYEQAAQCAIIAHNKGKCVIMSSDDKDLLQGMCNELNRRGLAVVLS